MYVWRTRCEENSAGSYPAGWFQAFTTGISSSRWIKITLAYMSIQVDFYILLLYILIIMLVIYAADKELR